MSPNRDTTGVGRLLKALAIVPFAGSALSLSFVLLYISTEPDWEPMWSEMAPHDYAIPVTMTALAVVCLLVATIVPRFAVRAMRRRLDAASNLEVYEAILLFMTALLSIGVLVPGFVNAFMLEDLAFWAVTVVAGALPIVLSWPTNRRREKWARVPGDGA